MSDVFEPNELYRFENVVLDLARQFGNESRLSQDKLARLINRAAVLVVTRNGRQWRWQKVMGSFTTSVGVAEYTLPEDVRDILLFWKTGANRGLINKMPEKQFRAFIPDESVYSGIPTLWDDQGVDSNGSKVVSLWPVPSGSIEVKFQYYRKVVPVRQPQTNLIAYWGMPPDVIECVIQMATALSFKGVDDARYKAERGEAEEMAEAAFMSDQHNGDTTYQPSAVSPEGMFGGGVMLPPEYGWNGD